MRIASWNIGSAFVKGESGKYDVDNVEYFIQALQPLQADIICLQEVGEGQAELLAKQLKLRCSSVLIHPDHLRKGNMYLAVLSKEKPLRQEKVLVPMPVPPKEGFVAHEKGFLITTFSDFAVLSGHLPQFLVHGTTPQDPHLLPLWQKVESIITGIKGPVLVGADFNTDDLSLVDLPDFEDAITEPTTPAHKSSITGEFHKAVQTDHILFSKHWRMESSEVVKGVADHYLACAELKKYL